MDPALQSTARADVPPSRKLIRPGRDAALGALTVFVAFTATVLLIWRASLERQAERMVAETSRIAGVTAGLIDRAVFSPDAAVHGLAGELRARETSRLAWLMGTRTRLAGLYALSRGGDDWVLVLDAQRRTELGTRVMPTAALEAFTTHRVCHSTEYLSEAGPVISVFTPVESSDGAVLGVVGADILAASLRDKGGEADQVLGYGLLFTVVCMIGMGALVYRLRSTMRDAMAVHDARMIALEENSAALGRAQERSGAVLASMSHEVRTPLTAILGFTELLLEPNEDVAVLRSHAQTIRRNSQHLLDVLNDALDMSKLDAGMMRAQARPFDPRRLVQEAVELFTPRAKERHITLRFVEEGSIPACVASDEFRVRQILLNLISNALKFTEQGGVTVTAHYDAGHSILEYRVTDTGVGIAPGQFERIFKPYQQSANEDVRRFGGTGLGLAISKRLAELLNGTLSVQSRLGEGATFSLRLPARVVSREEGREREGAETSEAWKPRPSWRVLAVEDTLEHQKLLYANLRRGGHTVDVCETGERALNLVRESDYRRDPYTILIVDAHLPGMSGSATVRAVREHGFRGPILAVTADESDEAREECLLAGCGEVLTKPIDRERLLSALSRLVHGSKSAGAA
jgi:signal transduction histidine kinase/CheY-like chemotaxis protein